MSQFKPYKEPKPDFKEYKFRKCLALLILVVERLLRIPWLLVFLPIAWVVYTVQQLWYYREEILDCLLTFLFLPFGIIYEILFKERSPTIMEFLAKKIDNETIHDMYAVVNRLLHIKWSYFCDDNLDLGRVDNFIKEEKESISGKFFMWLYALKERSAKIKDKKND
ncbi:hypothetical protein [Cognatishimia sp.]|uniref:hypothetical protein n=1 Tax=Cognatishimia sp. TaxID=2211648 RepID=UPI0035139EAA|nr:hypothetical protein [Cognatishimia sp.]